MSCGARLRIVRTRDWEVLDQEVREIMQRVWGVKPIRWGDQIILPMGPPTAVERLRTSVEWIRQQTETQVLKLNSGQGGQPNLDWLDAFVREHEEHEH